MGFMKPDLGNVRASIQDLHQEIAKFERFYAEATRGVKGDEKEVFAGNLSRELKGVASEILGKANSLKHDTDKIFK